MLMLTTSLVHLDVLKATFKISWKTLVIHHNLVKHKNLNNFASGRTYAELKHIVFGIVPSLHLITILSLIKQKNKQLL